MLWPDYGYLCSLPSADHRTAPDLSVGGDHLWGSSRGDRLPVVRAILHREGFFVRALRIVSSQNERRTPSPCRAGAHLANATNRGASARSGDARTFRCEGASRYPVCRDPMGTRSRRISSGDRRRNGNSRVEREGSAGTRVRPSPSCSRPIHVDVHRPPRTIWRGRGGVLRSYSSPLDRSRGRAATSRTQGAFGDQRCRCLPKRVRANVAPLHSRREHLPFSRRRLVQDRSISKSDHHRCHPTPKEDSRCRGDERRRTTSTTGSSRAWPSTGHCDPHHKTQRSQRRLTRTTFAAENSQLRSIRTVGYLETRNGPRRTNLECIPNAVGHAMSNLLD